MAATDPERTQGAGRNDLPSEVRSGVGGGPGPFGGRVGGPGRVGGGAGGLGGGGSGPGGFGGSSGAPGRPGNRIGELSASRGSLMSILLHLRPFNNGL